LIDEFKANFFVERIFGKRETLVAILELGFTCDGFKRLEVVYLVK
jgi:hypothetical protein